MGKKLSTLTAGVAAVALAAATSTTVFGYSGQTNVTINYDGTQGSVEKTITKHSYHPNEVTLTVSPKEDYVCSSVSGSYWDHRTKSISGLSCEDLTFSFPNDEDIKNVTVNVVFARKSYDITVNATTGGTASANVEKSISGETITLTATPEKGYQIC